MKKIVFVILITTLIHSILISEELGQFVGKYAGFGSVGSLMSSDRHANVFMVIKIFTNYDNELQIYVTVIEQRDDGSSKKSKTYPTFENMKVFDNKASFRKIYLGGKLSNNRRESYKGALEITYSGRLSGEFGMYWFDTNEVIFSINARDFKKYDVSLSTNQVFKKYFGE